MAENKLTRHEPSAGALEELRARSVHREVIRNDEMVNAAMEPDRDTFLRRIFDGTIREAHRSKLLGIRDELQFRREVLADLRTIWLGNLDEMRRRFAVRAAVETETSITTDERHLRQEIVDEVIKCIEDLDRECLRIAGIKDEKFRTAARELLDDAIAAFKHSVSVRLNKFGTWLETMSARA
jgi:hypothetical protein